MNKKRTPMIGLIALAAILAAGMAMGCSKKNAQDAEKAAPHERLLTAEAALETARSGSAEAPALAVIPSGQMQGGGTAESPFLIYTEADLRSLDPLAEAHYRLMANITLTGDNDSDPENGNWMPQGFPGVFDGNGHTVTGLRINIPVDFPAYTSAGLFSETGGDSRVENLGLIDVHITAGTQGIGGIAGVNQGAIRNCYVTGSIGDTITKGGIAGSNTHGATIQNCYFAGRVFHRREHNAPTSGGIAGISGGTVANCVSLAESVTEEPETAVGRVVGRNRVSEWEGALAGNYGWNGTTTGQSYLYYVAVPRSAEPASKDGADITAAELKTRAAWEKAGFSFGADSVWVWNGADGMPGLRNQQAAIPWPPYLENPAAPVPSPNMEETG